MKSTSDFTSTFTLICAVSVALAAGMTAIAGQRTSDRPAGDPFEGLAFRSLGPATMGGRVGAVAVLETRPAVFYAAAATGGLWRTTNNGTTWEPVFDHEDVVSIGDVAIPPGDPNLVWVGTGENNNRQSSSWGGGVFKSTDGGRTWKNMGLVESRHIGRIVIDPVDHDVVYVAAAGHLWGPNPDRGVFKTSDGGVTWSRVLFVDDQTGATDLVMDPSNDKVLYAAMYQRQRSAWGYNGGGPGSGIYKSTDAGRSWTKLTSGLPAGPLGRIGLDVYRKDTNVLVALVQHEQESGVYRSEDAGGHWTKTSAMDPRPMYFSQVRIDPADAHRVYVLGVRLFVSDDGGKNFVETRLSYARGGDRPRDDVDLHALWIDLRDPAHLVLAGDVGVATSYDRGRTWDYIDNLPIGQFYHVGYDMDTPYHVYGGLQDNDVWVGPSAVRNRWGIANHDWLTLTIGDGFVALADPRDSRTIYGETQDGNVVRVDRDTNERQTIRPQVARGEPPLRWNWDTPLVLSSHDPNTLFIGANRVFKSTDRGRSWSAISPDLTRHIDRETLPLMGVAGKDIKISKNDGVSSYSTLVAFVESPKKARLYYAGADDGAVHVSKDGGTSWIELSGKLPGLPANAAISRLVASAFDEGVAYATFNNHRNDDYKPYVYATADYGATWRSLASTLPAGQVVNCLTEDPKNRDVLYLGTEFGLFVSLDRGVIWTRVRSNLPTVPIDEITIQPRDNDLLLATHGRSLWILYDLTPIQRAADAAATATYLFDLRRASQFNPSNEHASYPGDRRFWGENRQAGTAITFRLTHVPKELTLSVRDAAGAIVREFSSEELKSARRAGTSRIYWDLRHQPLDARQNGPFVLPGEYRVTLGVDGREVTAKTVRVDGDPQIPITDSDRRIHHDAALALHDLHRTANDGVAAVRAVGDRLRVIEDVIKQAADAPSAAKSGADDLRKRVTALARQLGAPVNAGDQGPEGGGGPFGAGAQAVRNQIATLKGQIMAATAAPTSAQTMRAAELREDLAKLIAELNDVISTRLPDLQRMTLDSRLSPSPMKPIPPVTMPSLTGR